ncbi:nitrilase-related carbon-nitrogen hydrolase [Rhodospirillum sp. A1_3_36]|uniref:nitrilase-related carbon-nitrogen hydrolase n=1 Tax=Rhodospirillum sp. A1_3_36 TaxID=3391666 RepID=UPI0039A45AF6
MSDGETLRCACAQIDHDRRATGSLLERHREAIAEARDRRVDLLVFPETSLTGYPQTTEEVRTSALWSDGAVLRDLALLGGPMTVVVGFVERGPAGLFYNSIAWLRDGQILAVQRKINLPTYGALEEGKLFAEGTSLSPVDLDRTWRCAGLICADFWNPGLLCLTALRHPTVLAMPIASTREAVGGGFSNENGWDLACRYGAMIYGLPTLRCNWTGHLGSLTFWGNSAIYGPEGEELARGDGGESLIEATLSLEGVVIARQRLPTARTSNPTLLARELSKVAQEGSFSK